MSHVSLVFTAAATAAATGTAAAAVVAERATACFNLVETETVSYLLKKKCYEENDE